MSQKKRILSGMRPTGPLHLGNLLGALANWVNMQDEYECYFFIADWHALTSDYDNTAPIENNRKEIMLDWLSAGLTPEKSTLFVQSYVKEHAELFLLLTMITPVPWLERNPTYKEQIGQLSNKDLSTFGFLGYPVLQAADIIIYRPHGVPVGVDQAPHVEITREIARRFNHFYGDVFPEPATILTETPKILGMDRRKMSKSYGNAIFLSDSPEDITKKVSRMITDPQRARKSDPGNPDVCNVYDFHQLYTDAETVKERRWPRVWSKPSSQFEKNAPTTKHAPKWWRRSWQRAAAAPVKPPGKRWTLSGRPLKSKIDQYKSGLTVWCRQ
jgi:tryptophanyl-tRNA synthetase